MSVKAEHRKLVERTLRVPVAAAKAKHRKFMERTLRMHHAAAKRSPGGAAPFTVIEFRKHVLASGVMNGALCWYCAEKVTVLNFSADHVRPLGRKGSAELYNINVCCCKTCNTIKGDMTHEEFKGLMRFLDGIASPAKRWVLSIMKTGAPLRLAYGRRGKRKT